MESGSHLCVLKNWEVGKDPVKEKGNVSVKPTLHRIVVGDLNWAQDGKAKQELT